MFPDLQIPPQSSSFVFFLSVTHFETPLFRHRWFHCCSIFLPPLSLFSPPSPLYFGLSLHPHRIFFIFDQSRKATSQHLLVLSPLVLLRPFPVFSPFPDISLMFPFIFSGRYDLLFPNCCTSSSFPETFQFMLILSGQSPIICLVVPTFK